MILITDTFSKSLKKIRSVTLDNISTEIEKHISWLDNLIELDDTDGNKLYKWYLLSKKVRMFIYFEKVGDIFIHFYIVKKETKKWYNITSDLEWVYLNQLDKCIEDVDEKRFRILK